MRFGSASYITNGVHGYLTDIYGLPIIALRAICFALLHLVASYVCWQDMLNAFTFSNINSTSSITC